MTITSKDIKNLAELARIEISESEAEGLTSEIDSILEYIGQTKDAVGDMEKKVPELHNVMRDDVVTNEPGQYAENLLKNSPAKEGNYFKVKKIL